MWFSYSKCLLCFEPSSASIRAGFLCAHVQAATNCKTANTDRNSCCYKMLLCGSTCKPGLEIRRDSELFKYPGSWATCQLKDRNREKNKASLIQGKTAAPLTAHSALRGWLESTWGHSREEMVEEITKSPSTIYQQLWLTREVPDKWRLANRLPVWGKIWGATGLSAWPGCWGKSQSW